MQRGFIITVGVLLAIAVLASYMNDGTGYAARVSSTTAPDFIPMIAKDNRGTIVCRWDCLTNNDCGKDNSGRPRVCDRYWCSTMGMPGGERVYGTYCRDQSSYRSF